MRSYHKIDKTLLNAKELEIEVEDSKKVMAFNKDGERY